jgi:predicted nuclease with TOPRIM domain
MSRQKTDSSSQESLMQMLVEMKQSMEEISKKVDQIKIENKRALEQFGSEVNRRFQQQQDTLETLEKEQREFVVSFMRICKERLNE